MPEIKNTFTGGKMNKDLDERLVPKGEYIDAMNVQVSTSENLVSIGPWHTRFHFKNFLAMGFFIWRTNLDVVRHCDTDADSSARRVHCRSVLLSITSALVACVEINRGKLNMETNQIRRMSISGPLRQTTKLHARQSQHSTSQKSLE